MNTYGNESRPIRLWAHWLQTTLLDGNPFCWEGVGTLYVKCEDEYIGVLEDTPYLFPPHIALVFEPAGELISFLQKRDLSLLSSCSQHHTAQLLSEIYSTFSCKEFALDLEEHTRSFLSLLLEGKSAHQEGFGTLSLRNASEGSTLDFSPDASFVERLQKPFEAFEPTILKSASLFPDLYIKKISDIHIETPVQTFSIPRFIPEEKKVESGSFDISVLGQKDTPSSSEQGIDVVPAVQNKKKWSPAFLFIPILLLLLGGIMFWYLNSHKETVPETLPAPLPQTEVVEAQKVDVEPEEQTDKMLPLAVETVERGTTLSGLAQKHYGNVIFWVCIYMENYSVISDYNNVPLGQELKIPPLDKYKMKGDRAEDISRCRRIEYLIYSSQYKPGDENNL